MGRSPDGFSPPHAHTRTHTRPPREQGGWLTVRERERCAPTRGGGRAKPFGHSLNLATRRAPIVRSHFAVTVGRLEDK